MHKIFSYGKMSLFSGLLGGFFLVATQYNSLSNRNPDSQETYGRLLSNAYRVIVTHERQQGTFSNIDYFKNRAETVENMYNPRPLTTGDGDIRNNKKRRELRMQRFELERFMNGYAGRIAKQNVVMMHVAYDCRVKNIEINPNMDKKCQQIFTDNKQQADTKVQQYLGNPNNKYIRPAPIRQPEQIVNPVTHTNNMPIQHHNHTQSPMGVMPPPPNQRLHQADNHQKTLVEIPQIPKNPVATIDSDNQSIWITEESNKAPVKLPVPVNNPNDNSDTHTGHEKFNPLKSIHPSLQNNTRPKAHFGIKPTSPMNVSYNTQVPLNQQFDPITTASIQTHPKKMQNTQNTQNINIPFSSSLVIPVRGKQILGQVNQILKQGNYNYITIIGHADKGNHDAIDMQMSLKRATHIQAMLKHANPNINMKIHAAGSSTPIKGTAVSDDRNRRVQIVLN